MLVLLISSTAPKRALEETKAALRKQGFKTELSDFDFSVPTDQRRFEPLLRGPQFGAGMTPSPLELMVRVGSNTALVIWKDDLLRTGSEQITWAEFQDADEPMESTLLSARDQALDGPIQFNLDASRGSAMLLPHLAMLRRFSLIWSDEMILDLHEQNRNEAWTNLLAVTRLATAWQPEPVEISQIVRSMLASSAFDATWQAMQAEGWSDAQLARLQKEWESVEFFKDLPEVPEFQGVCVADMCERTRNQRVPSMGTPGLWRVILQSPRSAPSILKNWWMMVRYQGEGIYEDEKAALLFYRDREVELQKAIQAPTWEAMRAMPGATNQPEFTSKFNSPMRSMMNLRMVGMAMSRRGMTMLAHTAGAEAQRRLILTALALERFHLKYGKYPATLQELTPDFLKTPPVDFMDGNPLRYELSGDGHFVLYSTGLDCVDNGGEMPEHERGNLPGYYPPMAGRMPGSVPKTAVDLVWPRPASSNEVAELHEQELIERQRQMDASTERESEYYWSHTAKRQASAEKILASPSPATHDVSYDGHPLSELLRNTNSLGTNTPALDGLLALHAIKTGDEPEKVTFELPISYDALTNIGSLRLYIDPVEDQDSDEGADVGQMECMRATNGDCLLVWNTIFEVPGKHALLAGIWFNNTAKSREDIIGPTIEADVTNLCQFSISSATFDPKTGGILRAMLPEKRADYSIDILTTNGNRVKTISGSTTDGTMDAFWDLLDDRGRKLRDESFNTVVHLKFPESGRSQTLRGP